MRMTKGEGRQPIHLRAGVGTRTCGLSDDCVTLCVMMRVRPIEASRPTLPTGRIASFCAYARSDKPQATG